MLSLYQIDFQPASGAPVRLLDVGAEMGMPLVFTAQQERSGAAGAALWGEGMAMGGARRRLQWSRVVEHASRAAAESYCTRDAATLPCLTTGHLRITIPGSQVWDLHDAMVQEVSCYHWHEGNHATLSHYTVEAGHTLPVSGLKWFSGIPHEWLLYTHGGSLRNHDGSYDAPEPVPLPTLSHRMVNDTLGYWMEVGFSMDIPLTGNATTGWTGMNGELIVKLQRSEDLTHWQERYLSDCPGSGAINGTGHYEYWARATVPVWWNSTMIDFTLTCSRYGKTLTGITLKNLPLSLPNFPYAMPAQAATLQADLRAAGYPGATVTSTTATLTATAKNHTPGDESVLVVTMSGTNVTDVSYEGTTISLPGYPYAMPAQAATLQTHLRAAGYSGAVVMLWGEAWTITLPNVIAIADRRSFIATFTPGDPFPQWDMFGNYTGENSATTERGSPGNIRDPQGNPLQESRKQFFRSTFTPGPDFSYP